MQKKRWREFPTPSAACMSTFYPHNTRNSADIVSDWPPSSSTHTHAHSRRAHTHMRTNAFIKYFLSLFYFITVKTCL